MRRFIPLLLLFVIAICCLTGCDETSAIKKFVAEENADCPIRYDDENLTLIKVQMHGNYVEYVYQDDEIDSDGEYSVAEIYCEDIANWKKSIIENIRNTTDDDYIDFYKECKTNKIGIEERYVGRRSGGECTIRIEYWEMP